MTALKKKEKDDLLEENRAIKELERKAREGYGLAKYARMELDSKPEKKSSNNFDSLEKAAAWSIFAGLAFYGGVKAREFQANTYARVRRENEGYHHPDDLSLAKSGEDIGKGIKHILEEIFKNKK